MIGSVTLQVTSTSTNNIWRSATPKHTFNKLTEVVVISADDN